MIDEYFKGDILTILDYIILRNDYVSPKQLAEKFKFHVKTGRRYIKRLESIIKDISFVNADIEDGCIRVWITYNYSGVRRWD